jgi:hypothetical protein
VYRWASVIVNGRETAAACDFPKQVGDEQAVASRLETLLKNPYLLIEGDGVLFLFPTDNIKYIQAYSAPSIAPDTAIRGATVR